MDWLHIMTIMKDYCNWIRFYLCFDIKIIEPVVSVFEYCSLSSKRFTKWSPVGQSGAKVTG